MAKDLTLMLEDHPGTLADMGEVLGKAGVNIDGMCGFTSQGKGVIHILVEDAAAARKALESAKIQVQEERDKKSLYPRRNLPRAVYGQRSRHRGRLRRGLSRFLGIGGELCRHGIVFRQHAHVERRPRLHSRPGAGRLFL